MGVSRDYLILATLTMRYHQRRRLQLAHRQQVEDARDGVRAD